MPRKGENIYKRKDGRWEERYIRLYDENGKAIYGYVYGKTYNVTKQLLAERKFRPDIKTNSINSLITYNDILDAWLQASRITVKESKYTHYFQLINSHIRPALGKYQLSKISTQLVESFIESLLSSGKKDHSDGLSLKTATDILTIIKSSMDYACYNNYQVNCNLKKVSIKRKNKETRVLHKSEQEVLTKALLSDMDLFKFGVFLALYTGIRIEELCALQWKDFDLEFSVVLFCLNLSIRSLALP